MNAIIIRGARTHNLRSINVSLTRNQLIVITGLSGSGKSSLAFDTIYAEGQRRYVESLSAYARQFLCLMEKPDVDLITGLSPSIAIEQKTTSHNPRSTVGTITELHDYLRLLFARVGKARCPDHGVNLAAQTVNEMVEQVLALPTGSKLILMAPIIKNRKGAHQALLDELRAKGFMRVRINGIYLELAHLEPLSAHKKQSIDLVIDRLSVRDDLRIRLTDSFETALKLGDGLACVEYNKQDILFSAKQACPHCDYNVNALEPRFFSFNSPIGACERCEGLGQVVLVNEAADGGTYHSFMICSVCEGTRLKKSASSVFVGEQSLPELSRLSIENLLKFFKTVVFSVQDQKIAEKITSEIKQRLQFLVNVGLTYLSLDRSSHSLSGGEAQRIRLASQIGSGLVGVIYILDEPSIGLHQRDNTQLLNTLKKLKDLGNTVIMVEHDEEAILEADYVVDLGPGAGVHGGMVVASGSPDDIKKSKKSLTGDYLSGRKKIAIPISRQPIDPDQMIRIQGASGHNLKNITVEFPIGLLTCVTGVSGGGKSTLINDTLYPIAAHVLNRAHLGDHQPYQQCSGLELLDKVVCIDQSPIGRTPRSNAATYTGVFIFIRELFAKTPEARSRGYELGRFSFNVKGGRCEVCEGDGLVKVEMHFLSDIYVECETCKGQRYNPATLEIIYKGKNIHEILSFTVEAACEFFKSLPAIYQKLHTLLEVGLGYITLGQSATTLSGGEAQRVKLAKELSKRATGKTLYILDEPTTGLHFHDIKQLLAVLRALQAKGNTLIIIEHDMDVIKTADWVIDLGPEGGDKGGEVVAIGTPEMVANIKKSHTGRYLKAILKK